MSKKYDVYESSSAMTLKPVQNAFTLKYPWGELKVGQSFIVHFSDVKFKSLNNYAGRMGKKLNKVFRVIDHGADIGYEVGRVK